MKNMYESVFSNINSLKKEKPELHEILDFYSSIYKFQEKAYSSFKPDVSQFNIDDGVQRNKKGLPFLTKTDITINRNLLKSLFNNISKIIKKKKKQTIPENTDFSLITSGNQQLIEGLLENSMILEKMARELNMEYPVFYFLVSSGLSPFIAKYAEKCKKHIHFDKWLRGYCPVCCGKSLVSKLEEEAGRKWLVCSICYTEWPFKRLACSFCENEDQETLRFFYDENDEAHRIDVCDKCKGYLKTIDIRKITREVNLVAENLLTLELDIVAGKEGFRGVGSFIL